jgi:hypothetical protein
MTKDGISFGIVSKSATYQAKSKFQGKLPTSLLASGKGLPTSDKKKYPLK